MKYSEFIWWLKAQGVKFEPGKGSHQMARRKERTSAVPFHGSKEISEALRKNNERPRPVKTKEYPEHPVRK